MINRKTLRMYSLLGEAGSFFSELADRSKNIDDLVVLTADTGSSIGLGKFMTQCPKNFYDVGIAEQNMIGIATGLAKIGMNVFATTYANFATMRSFEQIRMNLGYMQFPVKIVGASAGLMMGMSGNSHYSIEDVAIMRSIPNMTVIQPVDSFEAVKLLDAVINYQSPIYIRLTGNLKTPLIYKDDYDFQIGKAVELQRGKDVAIISSGVITSEVLKAVEILQSQNISTTVINMHTIKPLDTNTIDQLLNHQLIVTVEEHNVIGGLGSAVAEYLSPLKHKPPQIMIGINDEFPHINTYERLLELCGLTAENIANKIQNFIEV